MNQTAWLKRLGAMLRALLQRGQALTAMDSCLAVWLAREAMRVAFVSRMRCSAEPASNLFAH